MGSASNSIELENYINKAIQTSVTNVATQLAIVLKFFISMSFYDQYAPAVYKRTEQFLNSVAIDILNGDSVIYIDTIKMIYEDISGEDVANLAAQGYHGTTSIETTGRFWDEFIDWCNANLVTMLKSELRNQGLNV